MYKIFILKLLFYEYQCDILQINAIFLSSFLLIIQLRMNEFFVS